MQERCNKYNAPPIMEDMRRNFTDLFLSEFATQTIIHKQQ